MGLFERFCQHGRDGTEGRPALASFDGTPC